MTSTAKPSVIAFFLCLMAMSFGQDIKVRVDGVAVAFERAHPQRFDSQVMVPFRGVLERMGATVEWDPSTHTVSANMDDKDIELRVGELFASVDGVRRNMSVPAMILQDCTMVPIRFLSEALGAEVDWLASEKLVTIDTGSSRIETLVTPEHKSRTLNLRSNQVIVVTLDQSLGSLESRKGDRFTSTIQSGSKGDLTDIPAGTKIEGHVSAVHAMANSGPAILELLFERILFADGRGARIDGSVISLMGTYVVQGDNGQFAARSENAPPYQREVYTGFGAGKGVLVGIPESGPLEGAVLNEALAFIASHPTSVRGHGSNFTLRSGKRLGVRLNRDTSFSWSP